MKYIIFTIILLIPFTIKSQCNGNSQWPFTALNAPNWNNTKTVASNVYAGEYSIFEDFLPNATYTITTDSFHVDYITITTEVNNSIPGYLVLTHGIPPISFTPTSTDSFYVHTTLESGCGSDSTLRDVIVECTNCLLSQNVGIGTTDPNPSALMDLSSSDHGLLIPRHATYSRDAIGDPSDGLLIYNINNHRLETYDGNSQTWSGYKKGGSVKEKIYSSIEFTSTDSEKNYKYHSIGGILGRGGSSLTGSGTNLVKGIDLPVGSVINSISMKYQDTDTSGDMYVQFMYDDLTDGSYHFLTPQGGPYSSDGSTLLKDYTTNISQLIESDKAYFFNVLYTNPNRTLIALKLTYTEPE